MNRLEKELNKGNDCAQLKRSGLKYVSENANGKVTAVALVVSAYNASTINHPQLNPRVCTHKKETGYNYDHGCNSNITTIETFIDLEFLFLKKIPFSVVTFQ